MSGTVFEVVAPLDVDGQWIGNGGTTGIVVTSAGNLGVQTSTAPAALTVNGDVLVIGNVTGSVFVGSGAGLTNLSVVANAATIGASTGLYFTLSGSNVGATAYVTSNPTLNINYTTLDSIYQKYGTNEGDALFIGEIATSVLSSNVVSNGTFTANANYWSVSNCAFQSVGTYSNSVQFTAGAAGRLATSNYMPNIQTGKLYEVSYTIYAFETTTVQVAMGGYTIIKTYTASNTESYRHPAVSTNPLSFFITPGANYAAYIDNVIVRQIPSGNVYVAGDVNVGGVMKASAGLSFVTSNLVVTAIGGPVYTDVFTYAWGIVTNRTRL
jgi:hypothetical protein